MIGIAKVESKNRTDGVQLMKFTKRHEAHIKLADYRIPAITSPSLAQLAMDFYLLSWEAFHFEKVTY